MIVGLTGTIGAGKGAAVDYLKQKGFKHFAARDFITAEIERRGLPVDRDSMTAVSNEMRRAHGASYIIRSLLETAEREGGDAVIESVRVPAEAALLKSRGAVLIAIDADQKLRYGRIAGRGLSTDHIDFETFVAQEAREMENADPEKQNLSAVIKTADYTVRNEGSLEELRVQIDQLLTSFTK